MPRTQTVSGARIVWYDRELSLWTRRQYIQRLYQAAEQLRQEVQNNISGTGTSKAGDFPASDSGRLRDSIFAEVDESKLTITVGSPLRYALWLEYGTAGGQTITAKGGGVLAWRDRRTGKMVFAKYVRQGPIRPRPFLRRSLAEAQGWLRAHFERPIAGGAA
jgi:hypothetical protein